MLRPIRIFLAAVALATPVSVHAQVNWTGAINSDWDTAGNWSSSSVPTSSDSATFGAVSTSNRDIQLSQMSYSLTGLFFQDSGFTLQGPGAPDTTVLTITGGHISSEAADSGFNAVVPDLIVMTALDNTVTVTGNVDHELQFGDLDVLGAGIFTANVSSSLCLAGVTTISGAFVSMGSGQVCTEGGLTALSTGIENGLFMVEGDSSLGDVTVSSGGTASIMAGATASAGSVAVAGAVEVGIFSGNGETLVAHQGVTVQDGGSLSGLGAIQGDITVEAGGQLAPGGIYDDGALSIEGNVDFQIDSIALFRIAAPNVLDGSLFITGDLSLAGLVSLDNPAEAGLYTLIDFTGTRTGTFTDIIQDPVAGYHYDLIYLDHSVQLSVTAVPEPGAWGAVIGVGLLGVAALRRTRRTPRPRTRWAIRNPERPA